MPELSQAIRAIVFDVFGTVVDWRTGVADQVTAIAAERGASLDAWAFADSWRDRYAPSLRRVNNGERDWAYLDTLHRESLDELLDEYGVADHFDDATRQRLVRTWHRLPAWDDSAPGLARLRRHYTLATLSNGGVALLTNLVKAAGLEFDCILSAQLARIYKPAPQVYLAAAELLDLAPAEILMTAAHRSDIDAARELGLRTAFVERPAEKGPHRKAERADEVTSDFSASSLVELADLLGCDK